MARQSVTPPLLPPPTSAYLTQKRSAEAARGSPALHNQPPLNRPVAATTWAAIQGNRTCCGALSSTNIFCTLKVRGQRASRW